MNDELHTSKIALEKDFKWYMTHQKDLIHKYDGQYLVISNGAVLFSSSDKDTAYRKGIDMLGKGRFILQLCSPGEDSYSITFHTHRVKFAPAYA